MNKKHFSSNYSAHFLHGYATNEGVKVLIKRRQGQKQNDKTKIGIKRNNERKGMEE